MNTAELALAATRDTKLDDHPRERRQPVRRVGLFNRPPTPGTVGVIAQETGRYTAFSISLSALQKPEGSYERWVMGTYPAEASNELARDFHGDWLWLMGDDHAFAPDILMRLLAHNVDIVSPLCLSRRTPFNPYSFGDRASQTPIDLDQYPNGGLVEVEAAGSAGMLIRRHVLEAIGDPWFVHHPDGEDIHFCDRARARGFNVHVDLDTPLGHITTTVLWPTRIDGRWHTGFTVADGFQMVADVQA